MNFKENISYILSGLQIALLITIIYQVNTLAPGSERRPERPNQRQAENRPPRPAPGAEVTKDLDGLIKDAAIRGNKNAKVTIVKYNSFTCGYCNRAREPLMQLLKKYPNDVKIAYKHYNRNQVDMKGAEAVECAGEQNKFWEMYDTIFEKGVNGNYSDYAKGIGINPNKFDECIKKGKYKQKSAQNTEEGRQFGITGTPGFIINGKLFVGFRPFEGFEALVKEEL
ncbi:MAG: DsbA family protein [Spirochaetia bacterium]|nr:DsbA family protein [Spirochaetia bacterium]